jgi:hypothetical protein
MPTSRECHCFAAANIQIGFTALRFRSWLFRYNRTPMTVRWFLFLKFSIIACTERRPRPEAGDRSDWAVKQLLSILILGVVQTAFCMNSGNKALKCI